MMNKEQEELFYELKQYLPQHSYKWNILVDIEQLLIDLQQENEDLKAIIADLNIKIDIRNKEKSIICNQVVNYRDKGKRKAKEITNLLAIYKKTKEENEELKLQNFNLREDIMIQKKSFPNKEIKDKTFYDLYDMPTYEQLKDRIEYLQRSISRKEETIRNLQNELVETPKETELENRIDKAIDKLICWGEVLDARFQQDMLETLEGGKNE